jgi:hypothetical protein
MYTMIMDGYNIVNLFILKELEEGIQTTINYNLGIRSIIISMCEVFKLMMYLKLENIISYGSF